MKHGLLTSLAVAGLIAGAAQAQTTGNIGSAGQGGAAQPTTQPGVQDPRLNQDFGGIGGAGSLGSTTFQWVPGVGFVPMSLAPPTAISGINPGFNTFNPGFDIAPGYGAGVPYWYGPLYSGPLVDVRRAWMNVPVLMPRGTGWNGTGIPTLGLNVRAPGPAGQRIPNSRVRVKLTQEPNLTQRVAGSRQETATTARANATEQGEVRGGEVSAEQVRLTGWLEDVMEERPLREGTITSIGATGALVKFQADGKVQTQRFPMEEVFFFKDEGQLATAATDPGMVGVGTQVLIPEPIEPREAVAGSRQESTVIREGTIQVAPENGEPGRVEPAQPAENVAGSRQSTRRSNNRRPAR